MRVVEVVREDVEEAEEEVETEEVLVVDEYVGVEEDKAVVYEGEVEEEE